MRMSENVSSPMTGQITIRYETGSYSVSINPPVCLIPCNSDFSNPQYNDFTFFVSAIGEDGEVDCHIKLDKEEANFAYVEKDGNIDGSEIYISKIEDDPAVLRIEKSFDVYFGKLNESNLLIGKVKLILIKSNAPKDSYTAILTNESESVACDHLGKPLSNAPIPCGTIAFYGIDVQLKYVSGPIINKNEYSISLNATNCDASIVDSTYGIFNVTNISQNANTARVDVIFNLEGKVSITKTMSITKSIGGEPGQPGEPGAAGPSLTFFGQYNPIEKYPLSLTNRVVVFILSDSGENKQYYQTKLMSSPSIIENQHPLESDYWESFGGNFQSIATGTLLAEGANIANFIFKDEVMRSQHETVFNDVLVPNLTLDGKTGKITALNGLFRGEIEAESGKFSGGITVGKNAGIYGDEANKPPGSDTSYIYAPVFYSGKNEGGVFTAADAAKMLSSYFNPDDITPAAHKSFVVGKEGKMFCNNAVIKEGEIGNLKIKNGEIVGYDSSNKVSLKITKNNIETLDQLSKPRYQFITNDGQTFSKNEFNYGEYFANVSLKILFSAPAFDVSARTKIKLDYFLNVIVTENNLPQGDEIVESINTINLVSLSSLTTIDTRSVSGIRGTVEFDIPSKGQYFIDYRGNINLNYTPSSDNSGSAIFDYTIGSNIYEYVYETSTVIGADGIVSYWGPNDYFYVKKRTDGTLDIKMKGNIDISNQSRTLTVSDLPNLKIISYQDVESNEYPEGTIYYDENKNLKII